ncbi:MAG TPA: carboxymuconolactone decarboxylase family protein [Solirubrobacteraceae bacterium]|nr:carboxymuconolactone decarboxylase family protein [Solirubrobacteraceae bacterium]
MTATDTRTPRLRIYREQAAASRAMNALDSAVAETGLEPGLRELIKLRASQINGCGYCIDMHWKDARRAGETEQRLYGLTAWREAPYYTPRERAALALTEAVTLIAHGVPEDVYAEAERQFEPAELAALIWNIVAINAWNRLAIPTGDPVPGSYTPE